MTEKMKQKFNTAQISKKQFGLAGFFLVLSGIVWFWLFSTLSAGILASEMLSALIAAGFLWIIVFNITLFFLEKNLARASYLLLIGFLILLFGLSAFVLFGALIFLVTMLWALHKARSEIGLLVNFHIFRISKRAMPIFFTGLALFLAIGYNATALSDAFEGEFAIPAELFDTLFEPTETILSLLFSDYERGMSIEEFQQVTLEFFLPPEIFNQFGRNTIFSGDLVAQKFTDQSLRDFSFNWLNDNIKSILGPYQGFLPYLFILGLFFVFKTFFLPFMWGAFIATWVVVKLLLLYNVLTRREVDVVKREVMLL